MTRAALVKVQIARKELRLADDDYRSILERLTGHRSAADCSDAELGRVLDEFKAKGWTARSGGRGRRPSGTSRPDAPVVAARSIPNRPADHPAAKKARALWLSLWNLGEIHDPSEAALEAFARRQLNVERLQWADQALTYKLIEALKAMAERAGWSQQLDKAHAGREVRVLKRRLITAQCARLGRDVGFSLLGLPRGSQDAREANRRWAALTDAYIDRAITDLGLEIRCLPEAAG